MNLHKEKKTKVKREELRKRIINEAKKTKKEEKKKEMDGKGMVEILKTKLKT